MAQHIGPVLACGVAGSVIQASTCLASRLPLGAQKQHIVGTCDQYVTTVGRWDALILQGDKQGISSTLSSRARGSQLAQGAS